MRITVILVGIATAAAACGDIGGSAGPGPSADTDAGEEFDGARPTRPGAECFVDELDGPLGPQWQLLAGVAPTTSLATSALSMTDAFPTVSASSPPNAWIYEPDVDRANQLGWALPIGRSDFTLEFEIGWASALDQYTLGGFGVVNGNVQLELYAGVHDGANDVNGSAYARLRQDGEDQVFNGPQAEPGTARFRFERTAGVVTVEVDGAPVLTGTLDADLAHVVVFGESHSNGAADFEFGSIDLRRVETCVFD